MDSGILWRIDDGWLLFRWTYWGVLFSFMYGLNIPDLRSSETSRKFACFLFASKVIFKLWSLKVLHIYLS